MAKALHFLSMWTGSHSHLCLVQLQWRMPKATYSPQLSRAWPGWARTFFLLLLLLLREGGVPSWVVLWSLQHSKKKATTQDKHKQWHPLGRLTPRACVGACQPGLWPGGVDMAAEHPSRHPKSTGSPLWKVCISTHRAHCGQEKVAIHQKPPPPLPTNVAITSQATTS